MDGNNPPIYRGQGEGHIIIWLFNLTPQNDFLGKLKITHSDQTMHQTKKYRKQKSSVSMSYRWIMPKFCPQIKTWHTRAKKLILHFFGIYGSHNQKLTLYVLPRARVRSFAFFFFTDPLSFPILSNWKWWTLKTVCLWPSGTSK